MKYNNLNKIVLLRLNPYVQKLKKWLKKALFEAIVIENDLETTIFVLFLSKMVKVNTPKTFFF
jgi:hypothetical protein